MKIGKISCEILSFTEFYERDALAIVGGAEHPMDVCLIKVETVDGIVGYGESLGYGAPQSVAVTVNKVLARLLEGEDSSNILGLWDKMYKASFRLGRRGVMISAMSGVDIALWDILGKELGAPIYKLLAARPRRVKGYITGGYYRPEKDIQRLIEEVRSYREKGFDTVKIKIGGVSLEKDFERLSALKQHFDDEIKIAVDANNVYEFNTALKMGRFLDKLGVVFFEEPVLTDYPELSSKLASLVDVPIAGYETAYTLYEFRDIIAKNAVDIVQADACWSGGITEVYRIGVLARSYGLPLIPHYSTGGISFIANLHAALAVDSPLIEFHLRPNKLREALAGDAIRYQDGFFEPPKDAGLGVKLDEDKLDEFRASTST